MKEKDRLFWYFAFILIICTFVNPQTFTYFYVSPLLSLYFSIYSKHYFMNSFPIQNPTKVVKPITTNSLLMSTSKYSKEATQPAEDNKLTHAISQENFGARRLIIKS